MVPRNPIIYIEKKKGRQQEKTDTSAYAVIDEMLFKNHTTINFRILYRAEKKYYCNKAGRYRKKAPMRRRRSQYLFQR